MKNKFRILGVLIVMAIALCGAFNLNVPKYVFADESTMQESTIENAAGTFEGVGYHEAGTINLNASLNLGYEFYWLVTYDDGSTERYSQPKYSFETDQKVNIKAITQKAGTFTIEGEHTTAEDGTSFFIIGERAILKAVMEPGFKFDRWIATDTEGNVIDLPEQDGNNPTSTTYSIEVNQNIIVRPTWIKEEYSVTLASGLEEYFDITVVNNNPLSTTANYYNDEMKITISVKDDLYVKHLVNRNIKVNGVDLYAINNSNPMGVQSSINNTSDGFDNVEITLNIKDNVEISIDYTKMFTLDIVSGNDVDIENLIGFVSAEDYYAHIDGTNKYLLCEGSQMSVLLSMGNSIYSYSSYQLEDEVSKTSLKAAFSIGENKTFTITYTIKEYQITFKPYLKNLNGQYDEMEDKLYTIDDKIVKPGETISYEYDATTKTITITDSIGAAVDCEAAAINGYNFVGFQVDGVDGNEYTMSDTDPKNVEVKLLFEYTQYTFNVNLSDNYFASDIELVVSDNTGLNINATNNTYKLIKGANVVVKATTDKFNINGWTGTNITLPEIGQSGLLSNGYEFKFEPSEQTEYTITINVGFKYTTAQFGLDSTGCIYDDAQYKYSADIQISYVENVQVNIEDNLDASITFSGTIFTMDQNTTGYGVIDSFNTTVTKENNVYKTSYRGYDIYIHVAGENFAAGDKVVIQNKDSLHESSYEFVEGEGFVLHNADDSLTAINEIEIHRVKEYDEYSISLANLLPNAVVIYGSKLTDSNYYKIFGYNALNGTGLGYYIDNNGFANCFLPLTMINGITVRYVKLEEVVYVAINDINAFNFGAEYVAATKDGSAITWREETVDAQTRSVSFDATDNDIIIVSINLEKVTAGYKFDGFTYDFELTNSDSVSANQFTFRMNNDRHKNKTITINFSKIEYNIVSKILGGGSIIPREAESLFKQFKLTVGNSYTLEAKADVGYYVSDAYIGADSNNKLQSLITDNSSTATSTLFTIDSADFAELIIENAYEETTEEGSVWYVDINVLFTKHSYNTKIYFQLSKDNGLYSYPTVSVNNVQLEQGSGIEDGRYVYYVQSANIEYGTTVAIKIDTNTCSAGIQFSKLLDSNDNSLEISLDKGVCTYNAGRLEQNEIYTIQLDFIEYLARIESLNIDGGNGSLLGSGLVWTPNDDPITLGSSFRCNIWAAKGYRMVKAYYKDAADTENDLDVTGSIAFNPTQFKLDGNTFTIYLVFDYIEISLEIENALAQRAGAYTSFNLEDLASSAVSRTRDGVTETLSAGEYVVRKNDEITFTITPDSIGLILDNIVIGKYIFDSSSSDFISVQDLDAEGNLVGIYYQVKVTFTAEMIEELNKSLGANGNITITNNLRVRTYTFIYSYNYINYEFGVLLEIGTGKGTLTSHKDTELQTDIYFGSAVTFSHNYENNQSTNQYKIKGFNFNGNDVATDILTFNDLQAWIDLASQKHNDGNSPIYVKLLLAPSIFLKNGEKVGDSYLYTVTYDSKEHGLNSNDSNLDVTVGGNFEVVIEYHNGKEYQAQKPVNAGTYPVKITALIKTEGIDTVELEYDENVIINIKQREVSFALKADAIPITKTYNGLKSITASRVIEHVVINNVCEADKGNVLIDINKAEATFSGEHVNIDELYNILLEKIWLIDSTNQPVTNYAIAASRSITFEDAGKVEPLELKLVGIVAYNKVNDGSTIVSVNTDALALNGTLGNDVTTLTKENIKFYHAEVAKDYKGPIEVNIDYSEALFGADSINYTIAWDPIKINIHPYELEYYVSDVGTFKIVDYDKKCLIPLECEFTAREHIKGSLEYSKMISLSETEIAKGENLACVYEILLKVKGVNQAIPEGLYIYMPAVEKITKVFQKIDNSKTQRIDYFVKDSFLIVKSQEGRTVFGVVVKTTYLPLWLIILIVVGGLGGIGLIVLAVVIIRKRTQRKYQRYDKI